MDDMEARGVLVTSYISPQIMAHHFIAEPDAECGNSDSAFSDNCRQPPRPLRISVLTSTKTRWRAAGVAD
jgi:hypothetical protein